MRVDRYIYGPAAAVYFVWSIVCVEETARVGRAGRVRLWNDGSWRWRVCHSVDGPDCADGQCLAVEM